MHREISGRSTQYLGRHHHMLQANKARARKWHILTYRARLGSFCCLVLGEKRRRRGDFPSACGGWSRLLIKIYLNKRNQRNRAEGGGVSPGKARGSVVASSAAGVCEIMTCCEVICFYQRAHAINISELYALILIKVAENGVVVGVWHALRPARPFCPWHSI